MAVALVPSYWQHLVGGERLKPTKVHEIAPLDGLRGWACLLVFNFHFLFTYTWAVSTVWGFSGQNYGIHQLPIVHILISGHTMVAIFFVISGYVLSHHPLKLMRGCHWEKTFHVLSSATFRRALRLYIPSIAGTFLVFIAIRLGLYNYSQLVVNKGLTITGTNEQHPLIMRAFSGQFRDWCKMIIHLTNPFDWSLYYNNYNPHLWTIPLEFRGSLILYLTMLATSRLRSTVRISFVVFLLIFCGYWGRWELVLFISGMVMAEIDLINGVWSRTQTQKQLQYYNQPPPGLDHGKGNLDRGRGFRNRSRLIWIIVFLFGLYFGSTPNTGYKHTPGYMWTWKITPKTYPEPHRFPQSLGAVMIVCSVNNCPTTQKLFTNSRSQYLGRISYAFYIVHGPILHSLGYSIMPLIWKHTGRETDAQFCMGLIFGWLICFPVSLWAGDLFWRVVDIPSIRFTRWLEDRLIVQET
jgi:peptidoglycan/LPS O-acetylase OafA/YrhL